jgi:DNA replication protein DnaC
MALDVPVSDPRFGKATRCKCRWGAEIARQRNHLESIDGLRPNERELVFDQFRITDGNRAAYQAVVAATERQRGIVTLTGAWGKGKSHLLISAVNQARAGGRTAIYTTTSDLLVWLRLAFSPGAEIDESARWDLLNRTNVLAIDEMDRFNGTPWAIDQFFQLISNCWRDIDTRLTILATNTPISALPGEIRSRLSDGRAIIAEITGPDMRPAAEW